MASEEIIKKQNKRATSFGMSATFFVAAWVVHLFPETILNFYPEFISKILLAFSFFSLVSFDDKNYDGINGYLSDLGMGLGFLIVFISFINGDENFDIPTLLRALHKIFMWFFFVMGTFGTASGMYKTFSEVAIARDKKKREEKNYFYQRLLDLVLKILEVIIAIYTIFEFTGLNK